jgi:hypothetical protein
LTDEPAYRGSEIVLGTDTNRQGALGEPSNQAFTQPVSERASSSSIQNDVAEHAAHVGDVPITILPLALTIPSSQTIKESADRDVLFITLDQTGPQDTDMQHLETIDDLFPSLTDDQIKQLLESYGADMTETPKVGTPAVSFQTQQPIVEGMPFHSPIAHP